MSAPRVPKSAGSPRISEPSITHLNQDRCPKRRLPSLPPAWADLPRIRLQGAEACYLKFRHHPIDAQCLPAKSRFVLAIEREPLAEMLREESRARRDTQFQRFPS